MTSFDTQFFSQQVLLLTVGDNMMPMDYRTFISKDPFRFLICMQHGNNSLGMLRKNREAGLHFMPWSARDRVVHAGYISGLMGDRAKRLGLILQPAKALRQTRLISEAECVYECVVKQELPD